MTARLAIGAAVLMLAAGPAAAITATYELSATCTTGCAAAGLADGASVGGTMLLEVDGFTADGTFGPSVLESFSIRFGTATLTSGDNYYLAGRWGGSAAIISELDLRAGLAGPTGSGPTMMLTLGAGLVALGGYCDDAPGCFDVEPANPAYLGPLRVSGSVGVAPVPLPQALTLVLAGVAALVLAGRRRGAAAQGAAAA